MNSIRTKIPQSLRIILVTVILMVLSVSSAFASSREFNFSKSGAILMLEDGTMYRENDTGGAKAFVPFSVARSGDNMATLSKMTVLPGAQTGYGSWASSAALRYNAFSAYTGANSQYLAKIGAVKTKANAGSTWIVPPYYNHNTNETFVFRYAGMVVTGDSAMAGTNPIFPSDKIGSTSSSGSSTPATIYKRKIDSDTGGISWQGESMTLYGTAGGVHSFEDMYTNGMYGTSVFEGQGNIVSNKYTSMNEKYAQQAFEKWIDCDDGYGREYAEKAQAWKTAKNSSLEIWQILNQFFQIQGDPSIEESTLYFYMVGGKIGKHTYYTTYSTTGEIVNNVTPTFFAIKENESGEILAEAYRNHTIMSKENGGPSEQSTGSVKLEVGKSYTLEGVLSYYNVDSTSSKTIRSISLFVNSTGIASDAADLSISMLPTSYLPDASAFNHMSPIDHKSGGTIKASGNKTGDDGGTSYYYDGAAFITTGFTVTTELPQNGYLIIAVPDAFTENSDNDTMNDDRLAIRYTIVDTGDPPPPPGQAAFGDLNLGMPEYRDLHYIAQYEEPPEPVIITEERYSGYGHYESATSAPQSGSTEDYEEKVENRRDIWNAGEVGDSEAITNGWWEYTDRIWPNQVDDLENKCWLTDANGTWDQDTQFLRSKSGENSFGFGFRVSRSRGDMGSTLSSAVLEVQIYGVSPDTGEDGILLKEYTDGGTDYKTLRTGSIGVYEYSDVRYTGIVSCAAINGIENFPRIRVVAKISRDIHGESGICLSSSIYKEPAENSWEEEHDTVDRTFEAVMDDMRIVEVEIKDSEGIVVYNANRYNNDYMNVEVNGYYDREEDLYMKVVVEQTIE